MQPTSVSSFQILLESLLDEVRNVVEIPLAHPINISDGIPDGFQGRAERLLNDDGFFICLHRDLTASVVDNLLSWRHSGFSAHGAVCVQDPEAVAMEDPSESLRSRDIPSALLKSFEILELHQAGGTLLHFVLESIAGHFREEDPESMVVLQQLFAIEDGLIEIGELDSHFVLIVARPKKT